MFNIYMNEYYVLKVLNETNEFGECTYNTIPIRGKLHTNVKKLITNIIGETVSINTELHSVNNFNINDKVIIDGIDCKVLSKSTFKDINGIIAYYIYYL